MRKSSELRHEARQTLGGGWFWRILTVSLALQAIGNWVVRILRGVHDEMGIVRMGDFLEAKVGALRAGLDYALPTSADTWRMLAASSLELFLGYIFGAILMFGVASVLLKAVRRDANRWFIDSLGGFQRPLDVSWLLFMQNLRVFLWSLLLVVPGVVALYRYRQAWYVKGEHPDWTASACLAESDRLSKGYKFRNFLFDLSYLGWLVAVALLVGTGVGVEMVSSDNLVLDAMAAFLKVFGLFTFLFGLVYYSAGRVVFYRELKTLQPPCPAES